MKILTIKKNSHDYRSDAFSKNVASINLLSMKTKHFFAIIPLSLCLTWATAQSNFGEFRWGLKGGASFASVNNLSDGVEKDKGRVGFVGGGFIKIPLKHYISIRPEILFHMKGAKIDVPNDIIGQTLKTRFAMNYAEVPLSLDFDLPFFLDFHAGVQGALLLSKKTEVNGVEIKDTDSFNNSEFGWHVGTGIDLGNIGVHVRFQQSLTSFFESSLIGTGDIKPQNWGVSLTGAYMFAK